MNEPTSALEASTVAPERQKKWLANALAALDPLSVAGLFIFMLAQSWLRWSDPLIDFPRDLYIAWRLSEGDLLYQKIANWYGPLANLVEGLGFKIFGVGLDTIVWMNIALTVVILLLLRGIFGLIGNRLMVWLCSVTFVCVFMVGNYTENGGYNFITPYVAQSTYSFLGLLLVLWGLLKHLKSSRSIWLGVAGLGLAVAYLDKQEALLAAAGAIGIYFLALSVREVRKDDDILNWREAGRWLLNSSAWLLSGFMALWLPVFGYFFVNGGFVFAMRVTNFAVVFPLRSSVRHLVETAPFFQKLSGFDRPVYNFLLQAQTSVVVVFICAAIIFAGWLWSRARVFSPTWWLTLLIAVVVAVVGAGLAIMTNGEFMRGFAFPISLAAAGYSIVSLRMAWRRHAEFPRLLGQAVVGVAASLMFVRMLLNITATWYGFYLMPLACFFWFQLMVVEAPQAMSRRVRPCWLVVATFSMIGLALDVTIGRYNLVNYDRKIFPVGEGRDRFYTVLPGDYPAGFQVYVMVEAFHRLSPKPKTLVAFPEGIMVNYLLRVPTTLEELEFRPVALSYVGEQHVVEELKAHPPEAVYLFAANLLENNAPYFGADDTSGRGIVLWLNDHYSILLKYGKSEQMITGDGVDLLMPLVANDSRQRLLPKGK